MHTMVSQGIVKMTPPQGLSRVLNSNHLEPRFYTTTFMRSQSFFLSILTAYWAPARTKSVNDDDSTSWSCICQVARRVKAREQVDEEGQGGRGKRAVRYQACSRPGFVFLHPRSSLYSTAPDFVVYSQLISTAKRPYMAGILSRISDQLSFVDCVSLSVLPLWSIFACLEQMPIQPRTHGSTMRNLASQKA